MPRHRAPTNRHRILTTTALAGAALGASVLTPAGAFAADSAPGTSHPGNASDKARTHDGDSAESHSRGHHRKHANRRQPPRRLMSSGEQQYRNGCEQGYIADGCGLYTAHNLLRRGINPYL